MAMLLTLPHPFSSNGTIENAYCVIDTMTINKYAHTACFIITAYLDAEERTNHAKPFYGESFTITGDAYTQFKAGMDAGGDPCFTNAYIAVKASILDGDGHETNKWVESVNA